MFAANKTVDVVVVVVVFVESVSKLLFRGRTVKCNGQIKSGTWERLMLQ